MSATTIIHIAAYPITSFSTGDYGPSSKSLGAYFNTPGVAQQGLPNVGWILFANGTPYWQGSVSKDGILLPPDSIPPNFPVVYDYSCSGTYWTLAVVYFIPPPGPCPCSQADANGLLACPASPNSGNTVELASGRFIFHQPLLSIDEPAGRGWNLAIDYYPNLGIDGIFGKNFNYTQQTHLNQVILPDDYSQAIELVSSNNTRNIFTTDPLFPDPIYSSAGNNTGAKLVQADIFDPSLGFILYAADGTVTRFFGFGSNISTPGQMQNITDRYGNTQSFTWQVVGGVVQLTSVTDSYGRVIEYRYYGAEFNYGVREIEDFQGRLLNFQYDEFGHLVAVVLPSIEKAAPGNAFPGGTSYVFQYDILNPRPERRDDLIRIWYPNQTLPYIDEVTRTVDIDAVYREATPRYTIQYGQDVADSDSYGKVLFETVGDPDPGGDVGGTYAYEYTTDDLPDNLVDPDTPFTNRTIMSDRNGNRTIWDFIESGVVARQEVQNNRDKSSLEATSYVTWTKYNSQNQPILVVYPEGNSTEYTYEDGDVTGIGFVPGRRALLLAQTQLPGNSIGIASRDGSNGQTQLTQQFFYDPLFNQVCAAIDQRGNPINSSDTYFTPQNGGVTPTDANRSRYATLSYLDYQQNTDNTITNNAALQAQLGLTASQIQSLMDYVDTQMKATDGTGGIPAGFPRNLGDINGDDTGDGDSSGLPASMMMGNVVKVKHPFVRQLVPHHVL